MAYRDEKQIKSLDGIKCRLDEYEQERLEHFIDANGGQPAVVVRQAMVEFLDRRNIHYEALNKQDEFEQRKLVIAVGDRIRAMKVEFENSDSHNVAHMVRQ
jgi:hypothetical protein